MQTERINILIASDIHYAPYYGVLLTSLFIYNSELRFNIYLITDETWTQKETSAFKKMCAEHNSSFFVYSINVDRIDTFPQSAHINRATYFNLNAANILPDSIHKIIYMDGDMIVNGNVRPIWDIDLHDYACAMVDDCSEYDDEIYKRLEYDSQIGFYNNGVTVYNLDYLRNINFSEKALQFIADNPEKAVWMDQDAINVLLAEKTLRLPMNCNFQTLFLLEYHWKHYSEDFRKQILEASSEPIVIHYSGETKPWQWRYYKRPYQKEWDAVYKASLWHWARHYKPFWKYIKHLVKRLLFHKKLIVAQRSQYIPESYNL